jgi:hypothetical protein
MTQLPQSEDDWALTVYQYARLMGWLCHHGRPAQNRRGKWATPIQGDPGFFDWVFLRERTLFVELKREGEDLTPDQVRWYDRHQRAGNEVYVWRPSDWPLVQEALKRRPPKVRRAGDVDAGGRL